MVLRPPWNYDLMCAGYLLAVLPTLLVLAGAAVSVWRFIREAFGGLVCAAGFFRSRVVALVFMNLKVPCYAQAKAFYGLCALVPLCSFGAVGWEVLTRGRKWLRFVLGTILLVWAMNSFASLWIRDNSASTHVYLGALLDSGGRTDAARSEFARAVDIDPADALARRFLASALNNSGQTAEAFQQAVKVSGTQSNGCRRPLHVLSMILAGQGQMERAIDEARRAVELGPEDLSAHRLFLVGLFDPNWGAMMKPSVLPETAWPSFPMIPACITHWVWRWREKVILRRATNQFAYALLLGPHWVEAHLNFGACSFAGERAEGLAASSGGGTAGARFTAGAQRAGMAAGHLSRCHVAQRAGSGATGRTCLCGDGPQGPGAARHPGCCVCRSREVS